MTNDGIQAEGVINNETEVPFKESKIRYSQVHDRKMEVGFSQSQTRSEACGQALSGQQEGNQRRRQHAKCSGSFQVDEETEDDCENGESAFASLEALLAEEEQKQPVDSLTTSTTGYTRDGGNNPANSANRSSLLNTENRGKRKRSKSVTPLPPFACIDNTKEVEAHHSLNTTRSPEHQTTSERIRETPTNSNNRGSRKRSHASLHGGNAATPSLNFQALPLPQSEQVEEHSYVGLLHRKLHRNCPAVGRLQEKQRRGKVEKLAASSRLGGKGEFVSSNRGMLIPKHWEQPDSTRNNHSKGSSRTRSEPKRGMDTRSHLASTTRQSHKSRHSVVPLFRLSDAKEKRKENASNGVDSKQQESRAISFAPSFVVKTETQDPLVEDTFSFDSDRENHEDKTQSWWASPPRSRRRSSQSSSALNSKLSHGRWTVRYGKLRDSISADRLRLRNAIGGKGDPMDPRRTALSHTDITVLSDHPIPWCTKTGPNSEGGGSTLLVFVHQHRCQQRELRFGTEEHLRGVAWCFLSNSTVRENGLKKLKVGVQLRLYNSVVTKTSDNLLNIICSPLLEEYPTHEPSLPPLSELVTFGRC